jgi:hypothetical protein
VRNWLARTFGWLLTATVPATAVLLLHEWPGDRTRFAALAPCWRPHTDMVMPVLPGLAEAADGQQPTETRTNKVTEDV